MAQIDKLDEYTEIIETAQSGEDVRDAIIRAIIVIDEVAAKYLSDPYVTTVYKVAVEQALERLWQDVQLWNPSASRPDHPDIDASMEPLNDELAALLRSLDNDTLGVSIREDMRGALANVNSNIASHNIITLYCFQGILDLYNAFIDLYSDEESKEAARAFVTNSNALHDKEFHESIFKRIDDRILELSNASTGANARSLLLSIFEDYGGLLWRINSDLAPGGVPTIPAISKYISDDAAYALEKIAQTLIPNASSRKKWWVTVGDPFTDPIEAEYARDEIERATERDFVVKRLDPNVLRFYIAVDLTDTGFWTTILPCVYRDLYKSRFPEYDFYVTSASGVMEVTNNG